jgi:hypothetical protein
MNQKSLTQEVVEGAKYIRDEVLEDMTSLCPRAVLHFAFGSDGSGGIEVRATVTGDITPFEPEELSQHLISSGVSRVDTSGVIY